MSARQTFTPLQARILSELVKKGGDMTIRELEAIYEKGQGYQIAALNRRRMTEWIRPLNGFNACGLRITDRGRTALPLTTGDKTHG